jgi:hypothetical protein
MRRPPPGQPPGNGVLTPMPATAANLIRRRIQSLLAGYVNLLGCSRLWTANDPTAGACFLAVKRHYDRRERRLIGAVAAVQPQLRGACGQLALISIEVAGELAQDVAQLAAAGASPDRRALPAAAAAVGVAANNLDLEGRLERFVVLCAPRPSARST